MNVNCQQELSQVSQLLTDKVIMLSQEQKFDYIVFAAGICDLTHIYKHEGGSEVIYDKSDPISTLTSLLDKSIKTFQNLNIKVKFVTIAPLSLLESQDFLF